MTGRKNTGGMPSGRTGASLSRVSSAARRPRALDFGHDLGSGSTRGLVHREEGVESRRFPVELEWPYFVADSVGYEFKRPSSMISNIAFLA